MKYNVVFLGIGEDSCGDAIAIRLWDGVDEGSQHVIVIDGGYKDDWKKIQAVIKENFNAAWINLVISTHPDKDHIGGLTGVVENMVVKKLWMHLPWDHSDDYLAYRQDEFELMNATAKLKGSLQSSNDLALAADASGVGVEEPFVGKQHITPYGVFTVLSPTVEFYEELLPQILDKSAAKNMQSQTSQPLSALLQALQTAGSKIASKLEDHDIETLSDSGNTSPSNNTSTVILLELNSGEKLLFTGDAGLEALDRAHQAYTILGHMPGSLNVVQVPHHGSRQNVGPTILDKFLGSKTSVKDERRGTAYVSAASSCTKDGHPKKSVANAFRRRGYPVFHTSSRHLKHGHELKGYSGTVEPLPHFNEVEGD